MHLSCFAHNAPTWRINSSYVSAGSFAGTFRSINYRAHVKRPFTFYAMLSVKFATLRRAFWSEKESKILQEENTMEKVFVLVFSWASQISVRICGILVFFNLVAKLRDINMSVIVAQNCRVSLRNLELI